MSANPNQSNNVNKYNINLLQAELMPEKVLLTLSRVVIVWSLVLSVMIGWAVATNYAGQELDGKLTILKQENSKKTKQLENLTAQLTARKVDSRLADRLATIKLLMNNKQSLHAKLTNPNVT